MTDVKYLPTFKIGEDIVVFPWKELRGDTHEEAMSRLNPFTWDKREGANGLWAWLMSDIPMSPTGETVPMGKEHPIRYYDMKVDGWECWLIGGEKFDELEKEYANQSSGVQASD